MNLNPAHLLVLSVIIYTIIISLDTPHLPQKKLISGGNEKRKNLMAHNRFPMHRLF
jgi:hypothetical protein